MHWVLGEPDIFLNSVGDVGLLPKLLKAASDLPAPPSDAAMADMEKRIGLASIFGI